MFVVAAACRSSAEIALRNNKSKRWTHNLQNDVEDRIEITTVRFIALSKGKSSQKKKDLLFHSIISGDLPRLIRKPAHSTHNRAAKPQQSGGFRIS